MRKILPAFTGLFSAFIFWGAGGALIRQLPIGDEMKGLCIISGAVATYIIIYRMMIKLLGSK